MKNLRHALILQRDGIIFSLLERSPYFYNADKHDPKALSAERFHPRTALLFIDLLLHNRWADTKARMSILFSPRLSFACLATASISAGSTSHCCFNYYKYCVGHVFQ
ncbi:hypothetical protein HS088_TW04G00917 [Tripterygium wilfordii]|uniref:chorismate mutase n=1 Tax=Tripterygium wilfordii TaxID=458696 RepID=A0A7J7DS46_TRIWF|nr:hypothetical protein HS088_TW04G00917 [Tripterygium wilfordii]